MRTVAATRYVTPLREGGSLPAVVEADDDGLYVLKFRGAGQGAKALIAELVAGEVARALGLPVPEIVFIELDADLARTEPDPEIQDLIRASGGLNLGLDYLSGSLAYDPAAFAVDPDLASRIVWFDALVTNLDRTARNTNLLVWHRRLWLIDHGAALYFHHAAVAAEDAPDAGRRAAAKPFPRIAEHVLLARATRIGEVDAALAAALTPAVVDGIVGSIPDAWLEAGGADRMLYAEYLAARVRAPRAFAAEAMAFRVEARHDAMTITYDYAIVRVVPRVERGEFVNAGVVVSCDADRTIEAQVELDAARVLALDPHADLDAIRDGLAAFVAVCRGDAAAGALAAMPTRERFHWLVAPRSAVIQTSPVHTGRAHDVASALARLFDSVVRVRGRGA